MKKIILFMTFLILLCGCSVIKEDYTEIEKPKLSKFPLNGQYVISKFILNNEDVSDSFGLKNYVGKEVAFTTNGALVGEYYGQNLQYKSKNVNASSYLMNKYNITKKKLDITSDTVDVIDVYSAGEFFCEIIKDNVSNIYVVMNGMGSSFIKITQVKDTISDEEFEDAVIRNVESESISMDNSKKASQNGFLLGIKSLENDKIKYLTYFFRFSGTSLSSVTKIDRLICPRDNEFIELKIVSEDTGDYSEVKTLVTEKTLTKDAPTGTKKEINYLGQDYYGLNINSPLDGISTLSFRSLQRDDTDKALELSDILPEGQKLFIETAKAKISSEKKVILDDHNFGLKRSKGFWKFFGRANFIDFDEHIDFDINVIVPKKVIKYENLSIPLANIRKKLPGVKDAFTSPNNKFLITLENNAVMVYTLNRGQIEKNEVYRDELSKPTAVMTEWSVGDFTSTWQKFLDTLGGKSGKINN